MRSLILTLIALAALAVGGLYYHLVINNPQRLLIQQALGELGRTAATHDRAKISGALDGFLTDGAQITLNVNLSPGFEQHSGMLMGDQFTKTQFIHFIDTVLYSLDDYGFETGVKTLLLAQDKKSASVTFRTKSWGEGKSYAGGVGMFMHFSADGDCTGTVSFVNGRALLSKADCEIILRSAPAHKP